MNNIPQVKLGIVAVSRDCFPISAFRDAAGLPLWPPAPRRAWKCTRPRPPWRTRRTCSRPWKKSRKAGCNALVVFLGNFGPETPETLIAKNFDGPVHVCGGRRGATAT